MIIFSKILRPSNPNHVKESTYECGQSPWGAAHDFMMKGVARYFIYALIFFVFDAFLWVLITYAVVNKTFLSFTGFLVYTSIVSTALIYFLKSSEEIENERKKD